MFDADGNPHYTWTPLASGRGIVREQRRETDDTTGITSIYGEAVMAWPADAPPPAETATLTDQHGTRWAITAVDPLPEVLRLTVERTEDAP